MQEHLKWSGIRVSLRGRALAVVLGPDGKILEVVEGKNLVTNEGDLYYAQMAAGETPDTDFTAGGLRLGTDNTAPTKSDTDVTTFISGSGKAVSATYPKTNDSDADNTGAATDTVSWKFSYSTSDFNASGIIEGAIVDNITSPTKALCHFLFASSFTKSATNTLIVFVNHNFLGS